MAQPWAVQTVVVTKNFHFRRNQKKMSRLRMGRNSSVERISRNCFLSDQTSFESTRRNEESHFIQ